MYYFSVKLQDSFENAIKRVTEALQQEKFGILNEISVDTVLKNKLNVDIPHYRILHACNPSFAYRMIGNEANAGCLLPCNVVVRKDEEGSITVAFMDPVVVFGLTNHSGALLVAEDAKRGLMKVHEALASSK